jgi:hypothetical protein
LRNASGFAMSKPSTFSNTGVDGRSTRPLSEKLDLDELYKIDPQRKMI